MTEPRRKNIKQHTPHWKEEVRNACLQRIRDSRDKLIWDKRAGKAQQQAALHSIIAETSARIAASKQPGAPSRQPDIWDASVSIKDLDAHLAMLEGPEYDRLMQEMAVLLHEPSEQAWQALQLQQADQHHDAEMHSAYDDMLTSRPTDAVICPVCCKAHLVELQGIIACPRGDVRLDLRTEQLNLQDLRHRLASVLEAHTTSCPGRVEFSQKAKFGPPALWASCGTCHLLQMVA